MQLPEWTLENHYTYNIMYKRHLVDFINELPALYKITESPGNHWQYAEQRSKTKEIMNLL
jgi:hypothetical protein